MADYSWLDNQEKNLFGEVDSFIKEQWDKGELTPTNKQLEKLNKGLDDLLDKYKSFFPYL